MTRTLNRTHSWALSLALAVVLGAVALIAQPTFARVETHPWATAGKSAHQATAQATATAQASATAQANSIYYPAKGSWTKRAPAELGMDPALLDEAVAFAKMQETNRAKDLSDQVKIFGRLLGPMPKERGDVAGVIIRKGYIVAEFGDTGRADPTYSVAKSYLSTVLGLTIDRGLIKDVQDPVRNYIKDGGYDSPHNAKITWHHHAQQTSEWEGTMWGKPHTFIGIEEFGDGRREPRDIKEPGTHYEYNDVRINRLALSLLTIHKRPLPEVLKQEIMDPIGASDTWQWLGYNNSDATIDGKVMKSVTGGTRWGGGIWMSTLDHARFGYLFMRRGKWNGRQLVSESWITRAVTRGTVGPDYGYLWWLNTDGKAWPDAPKTAFAAQGAGSNTIWVDPEHELVVVWRWHRGTENEFYKRVIASIKPATTSQDRPQP